MVMVEPCGADVATANGAEPARSNGHDDELTGARLVMVEDDPSAIAVMASVADANGFELIALEQGDRLLAKVRGTSPDTVLLDVMLPGRSGYELCAELKAAPDTHLIPVVLMTSLDGREARLRGVQAGCDAFIHKPIDRQELALRLRSLVKLNRAVSGLDSAESVLAAFAQTVEAKDATTSGHCKRLARAGKAFGVYLGLPWPDVEALARGGALHDLGKIAIPDTILLKPGPLTPEERAVMHRHPIIGAELLAPLRTMRRVIPIVRHHHEQWDGKGYPDGLVEDQIPRLARVFRVLDVFDALTSERPYRAAMAPGDALEFLRAENVKGRWDPDLMSAFESWVASYGFDAWRAPDR